MAVLYVNEYKQLGREAYGGAGNNIQSPKEPALAINTVAIGSGSLQSPVFNDETAIVMVHTDAICSIKFGTDPSASATSFRLPANATQFYCVEPGSKLRVAVITNT